MKRVFQRKNGQGLCLARCANNETSAKRSCNRSSRIAQRLWSFDAFLDIYPVQIWIPLFPRPLIFRKKKKKRKETSHKISLVDEAWKHSQVQRVNLRPCLSRFITFSTGYESRALVDSVSVGQRKLEKSFSSDNAPCLLHFHHLQKSNRPKERQTLFVYINFSSNPFARSLLPSFLFQMYICMYTHTFFLFFFFFSFWTRSYCTGYCYFHITVTPRREVNVPIFYRFLFKEIF